MSNLGNKKQADSFGMATRSIELEMTKNTPIYMVAESKQYKPKSNLINSYSQQI